MTPKTNPTEQRRRDLAAIHAAAAKLGMDTADKSPASVYRTMLQAQGGATSAATMSADKRRRVLAYLLGQAYGKPSSMAHPDGWQAAKIVALWADLGAAGKLRDPSEEGLSVFIHHTQGVDSLRWLTAVKASQVIEALKAWKARPVAAAV